MQCEPKVQLLMLLEAHNSQIMLSDCQNHLMPVIFEHQRLIANAVRSARMAGRLTQPVWGASQNPGKLGLNLPELQAAIEFAGGETLAKRHVSAVAMDGATGRREWARSQ